jgi:hypothetical protein
MRHISNLVLIVALLASGMAGAMSPASDPVGGPALGFTPNADGSIIWPIIGIPGASLLGHRLTLGTIIRGSVVSPRQDYVIAIRAEDGQPIMSLLTSDAHETSSIGKRRGETVIAISPAGPVVALYNQDSKVLQVLRGLPAAPETVFEFDASNIFGRVTSLAVSDDASVALLGFSGGDSDSLWSVSAAGSHFVSSNHPSSMAFIKNRNDAVVADSVVGEAFLLLSANDSPTRTPLLSNGEGVDGLSGAAVSDDGRFAVIAGSISGNVGIVDLEQSIHTIVSCNCKPSGVYRMTGTAVFRLNEPPDGLVTILDLSSGKPRILIVPPEPAGAGGGASR